MLECEGRSRNVFAAISISISNQAGISRRIFRSQDRQVPPTVFCHSFLSFSFTRRLLFSGRPLDWSDFPLPCKSKSVVPRAAASWWSASEPIRPLPNFSALDRFGVNRQHFRATDRSLLYPCKRSFKRARKDSIRLSDASRC